MLRFFVVTGKWIVPRTLFYTILFASAAAYFFFSLPENRRLIIVMLMLIPTLINAFETVLFYKALSRTAG